MKTKRAYQIVRRANAEGFVGWKKWKKASPRNLHSWVRPFELSVWRYTLLVWPEAIEVPHVPAEVSAAYVTRKGWDNQETIDAWADAAVESGNHA